MRFLAPYLFVLSILCIFELSAQDFTFPQEPTHRVGNELKHLDQVIGATENHLKEQRKLRQMVQQYLELKGQYAQNTQDKQLSYRLVRKAHQVLEKVKELHLGQSFDQEFLSELTFFSNIAESK